ncbi:hypothetical protein COOONC_14079 [Cooperia oncophora]
MQSVKLVQMCLRMAFMYYNTLVHTSINDKPFFLFGREPVFKINLMDFAFEIRLPPCTPPSNQRHSMKVNAQCEATPGTLSPLNGKCRVIKVETSHQSGTLLFDHRLYASYQWDLK